MTVSLKSFSRLVALRSAQEIMQFACMGSAHQHRLSFKRILLRRLKREDWELERPMWQLDDNGYGTAVYTIEGPKRTYSLVAFSHYLDSEKRTDRVIAAEWDSTFALYDGVPTMQDIERLRANVPKQEAGRITDQELIMSRANRSVRMFDHVVERLANGEQPDLDLISEVGYLMRTTAVYGSGKFGAADFDSIRKRAEFAAPFQAEMLTVYLIREFTVDLVEHIAQRRSPGSAITLSLDLRRRFGVGNATGLGMAPYLVNHPIILNQWLMVRETALARVRSVPIGTQGDRSHFANLLLRAKRGIADWRTSDAPLRTRISELAEDLDKLATHVAQDGIAQDMPWDKIYLWADKFLNLEARELVVSLLLECHSELIDDLETAYNADENASFRINGSRNVASTIASIQRNYSWAFKFNFSENPESSRFWYASEEKLEPRLGERTQDAGSELEFPLAIARDVQSLLNALKQYEPTTMLASFLLAHPEHRHMVRRVQIAENRPYSEICDNAISAKMRPIDLLRFKLSFFGATRFDPRSDRWVRITLFQNAPFARELNTEDADDWFLPAAS